MNCPNCGEKRGLCYCSQLTRARIKEENVEHPKHYNTGSKEVIDIMQEGMTPDQFEGFLVGNIIKYVMRYPNKNGVEDILKAKWYLNKLLEVKGQEYINNSGE